MRFILASGSASKMKQYTESLKDTDVELVSAEDVGFNPEDFPEEDKDTYLENAVDKAQTVYDFLSEEERRNTVIIGDDAGFEVDYLNKEPGLHTRRYLGEDVPHAKKREDILRRMEGVDQPDRTARYIVSLVAILENGDRIIVDDTIEGYVTEEDIPNDLTNYDSIFYVPYARDVMFNLPYEVSCIISHRGKAIMTLCDLVKDVLGSATINGEYRKTWTPPAIEVPEVTEQQSDDTVSIIDADNDTVTVSDSTIAVLDHDEVKGELTVEEDKDEEES